MNTRLLFLILGVLLGFTACSTQEKTYIVTGTNEQMKETGNELARYLSETYPKKGFEVKDEQVEGSKNILLEISSTSSLINNEAYQITGSEKQLVILGNTPRAVTYGVYGLLNHLGWNFHLSFEVPPVNPISLDFSSINIENAPLTERRILFDWHNFLSGCTGWDLPDWEQWIDQGCKIGFNTVMVHAYGNNPMHSFSFNGKEKELGYLTTTQKGRDWGAQHVNDVRWLYGGGIFDDFEFGSEAAMVPEEERVPAARALMQQVFKYAGKKNMDVCFALDVDTWMANPQNIIKTLPSDALIEIGGYQTVNPEHPEGEKYYEAQLKQLFADYPEITMLAAWMRQPNKKPGQGSIWLLHDSSTLPPKWRREYFDILKQHPELTDERPYPGIFAISKIVKTYRKILDEVNPNVELLLGSWLLNYPKEADAFMPEYCGFIPLDWEVVLDRPGVSDELSGVGKNRKLYPVVWAHHDDHRYVGRPYVPFPRFNELLNKTNAAGYGIIHWTTHPLDLLFTNYENQVWQHSENESWETTVENFAQSLVKKENENLSRYFKLWFSGAPMFGRETSDYFLRLQEEYNLEGYSSSVEVVEKAKERLAVLEKVDTGLLTARGLKEYNYQLGMEQFIISFFTNHHNGHTAYKALEDGDTEKALSAVNQLDPREAIKIFAKTITEYGATQGEKGLLVSLNLRWLPDFIDLKQRTGLEPVRINFEPTSHDSLAQGAGHHTFFVDEERNFWLSLGEKEIKIPAEANGNAPLHSISESWVNISGSVEIPVKTMRNYNLPEADYALRLIFGKASAGCEIQVLENGKQISGFKAGEGTETISHNFHSTGGEVIIRIIPARETVKLCGLIAGAP